MDHAVTADRFRQSVSFGALIIAAGFVLSKLVGLLRTSLLLARFGAGDTTDTFLAAFKLPDLFFNILVLGALSAAFVPVFVQYWNRGQGALEAWRLTSSVLTVLVTVLGVSAFIAAVLAPVLVPLITPGFDPAKQAQTVLLTRIMLLATVFFAASNVFSGVLTALRRFTPYALAPVLYNVGIILGIVVFEPWLGLAGLGWGVVLGACLHLLIQLPEVRRAGFRFKPTGRLNHPGLKTILRLMGPRTLGLTVTQLEQMASVIIASTLAAGSVTVLAAANDLQTFPINVVGVSLAIAAFPLFSQAFHENNTAQFVAHFSQSVRRILLVIAPVTVLFVLLRAHLVRVIFGFGQFDWEDTVLIAQSLGLFSLSLAAQSLSPVMTRSFYALQDTRTPVVIGSLSALTTVGLSLALSPGLGVLGLALAFTIANLLNAAALFLVLRRRVGELDDARLLRAVGTFLLASLGMAAIVWLMLRFLVVGVDQTTRVGIFLQAAIAGVAGLIAYLGFVWFLAPAEVGVVRQWVRRFLRFGSSRDPHG